MELTIENPRFRRRLVVCQTTLTEGNMSFARGESKTVLDNRRRTLARFGLRLKNLAAGKLVHGSRCAEVKSADRGKGAFSLDTALAGTDGLISTESGLILAVTTADCLPVFIWDEDLTVFGVVHAGWQGLAEGALKSLVRNAHRLHPGSLYDFNIRIGVGVGPCCYTVGVDRLKRFFGYGLCHIHYREGKDVHLDLKSIAALQLSREGIPSEKIAVEPGCSACGGLYPSFRRQGEDFTTDLAFISMQEMDT